MNAALASTLDQIRGEIRVRLGETVDFGNPHEGRVVPPDVNRASLIDHTLLKPEATHDDIVKICREAKQYGFASVCVNPYWVSLVASELAGTKVKVCTVVGFPLGATLMGVKIVETTLALDLGAQE